MILFACFVVLAFLRSFPSLWESEQLVDRLTDKRTDKLAFRDARKHQKSRFKSLSVLIFFLRLGIRDKRYEMRSMPGRTLVQNGKDVEKKAIQSFRFSRERE